MNSVHLYSMWDYRILVSIPIAEEVFVYPCFVVQYSWMDAHGRVIFVHNYFIQAPVEVQIPGAQYILFKRLLKYRFQWHDIFYSNPCRSADSGGTIYFIQTPVEIQIPGAQYILFKHLLKYEFQWHKIFYSKPC